MYIKLSLLDIQTYRLISKRNSYKNALKLPRDMDSDMEPEVVDLLQKVVKLLAL
jgi:hypothetical protein